MGRVAGPFGVRGWIKIQPFTAEPRNLLDYTDWYLGGREAWRACQVEEVKVQGQSVVAKLAGCEDRDAAFGLRGLSVAVERSALPPPAGNEFYWVDLIGLRVVNEAGQALGVVARLLETGANDVLVLDGPDERMIPFVGAVVKAVDLEQGLITVDWGMDY